MKTIYLHLIALPLVLFFSCTNQSDEIACVDKLSSLENELKRSDVILDVSHSIMRMYVDYLKETDEVEKFTLANELVVALHSGESILDTLPIDYAWFRIQDEGDVGLTQKYILDDQKLGIGISVQFDSILRAAELEYLTTKSLTSPSTP